MKKLGLLLLAVVAVVIAVVLANGNGGQLFAGAPNENPAATTPAAGAPDAGAASKIAAPAGAEAMTVDYVHDGDTLFMIDAHGERLKVRLIGLDTPEVGEHAECFGDEARAWLRMLLPEGAVVAATHDADAQDRYGRELLYLWASDGSFVNLELVADGYGEALKVGANDRYWPQLRDAETRAQDARAGLWGAC